jgi:ABC-type siderophore export system fused ATPase/permease subunit
MLTGGVGIGFWVWDEWNNLNVKNIIIAILSLASSANGFALIKLATAFTLKKSKTNIWQPRTDRPHKPANTSTRGVNQTFKTKRPFCPGQHQLTVAKGEFVKTLIGHSGCGRSTLLNGAGLTAANRRCTAVRQPWCWARRAGGGFQNHSYYPG